MLLGSALHSLESCVPACLDPHSSPTSLKVNTQKYLVVPQTVGMRVDIRGDVRRRKLCLLSDAVALPGNSSPRTLAEVPNAPASARRCHFKKKSCFA